MKIDPKKSDAIKGMTEHSAAAEFRQEAEKRLSGMRLADSSIRTMEETIHELEVHQIELQMQNDDLRNAQAVLEASRERYVDFYDFAPVGYVTLCNDGTLDEINLTGAAMLGEERNSLLRRNFASYFAPKNRDILRQHLAAALKHDKKFICELSILRKDGTTMQVQLDSLRLQNKDEFPVLRIAMTDMSERIKAEEGIREQEEFFRMITENIEDFIAVLDLQGKRLYNSPSYTRLFKNTEQMVGTDSFSDVHPDDCELVKQVFNETVRSGTGLNIEYRFMLENGNVRHMESHSTLIRNSLGEASRVLVISHDITERKQIEEKIRNLAYFDTLTQLPNRRMLDDRMNQAMSSSKRNGHYCALMFLDLDNFKPLNDLYGHRTGDSLLIEVAHRISSCVREVDTVARFGGDEFVIMLGELDSEPESSTEKTKTIAEKIRSVISKPYVLSVRGNGNKEIKFEHQCTASIGVVMFQDHEHTPESLLNRADIAMYQAKEEGRNMVSFLKI
jgi:diguanylate cyclase (GGDEF)-like protein/PAS domain S-box-containing protein